MFDHGQEIRKLCNSALATTVPLTSSTGGEDLWNIASKASLLQDNKMTARHELNSAIAPSSAYYLVANQNLLALEGQLFSVHALLETGVIQLWPKRILIFGRIPH